MNSTVSIMDQLNRGVKVEGLMLPPGITLTRVDPNTVNAKKESINRVSRFLFMWVFSVMLAKFSNIKIR